MGGDNEIGGDTSEMNWAAILRRQITAGQHGLVLRCTMKKILSSQDQHVDTDQQSARWKVIVDERYHLTSMEI